ncbi:hypothetical protein MKA58_09350 [[Clostridium] innocuum]|nr:hypothetical protein [[Clostridium] innocuum]
MNKYQEALNIIKNIVIDEQADGYYQPRTVADYYYGVINELQELVDNPPLKFEELKEGMWVWDNSIYEKNYAQIKKVFHTEKYLIVSMKNDDYDDDEEGRVFKDNRFFRKEVPQGRQENER